MTPTRLALFVMPSLLAIAACSDGSSDRGGASKRKDPPSAPLGFELAMAGVAGADEVATATAAPVLIEITPENLAAQLAGGNVRLIDVRTDEEVAQGVIPGAEHMPLDRFDPAKLGPDDGRKVVLYCRSGRRSAIAAEKLAAATGEPVEHLGGGVLSWEEAGQPLAPL
jgi:rhodanese-related sulfurtransferase